MFNRLDLVRCASGTQFIITGPPKRNRPANPYSGIKVNGKGAEYKFGPKHNPVKVGTVTEDHPALQALASRKGTNTGTIDEPTKQLMRGLAHKLAPALRRLVS